MSDHGFVSAVVVPRLGRFKLPGGLERVLAVLVLDDFGLAGVIAHVGQWSPKATYSSQSLAGNCPRQSIEAGEHHLLDVAGLQDRVALPIHMGLFSTTVQ